MGNERRQLYKKNRQEIGLWDIQYARYPEKKKKKFTQI